MSTGIASDRRKAGARTPVRPGRASRREGERGLRREVAKARVRVAEAAVEIKIVIGIGRQELLVVRTKAETGIETKIGTTTDGDR